MTTDNTSNEDDSNNYNRVVTQLNDDTFESDTSAESQTHSTGKNKEQGDLSGEAAGVVRGVSKSVGQSVGRSIFRAPIGSLPKHLSKNAGKGILRQRVPIRQVARVSDRISTGWDLWDATSGDSTKTSVSNWAKFRSFGINLFKNTILGMAVFESYGYVVGEMAPSEIREKVANISRQLVDDENSETIVMDEPDEYARAKLPVHFGAGLFAGLIHGLGSTFFEWHPNNLPKFGIINTFHHSVAHSLLFGTYEGTKRMIINQVHSLDDETNYYGAAYLTAFGLAGGIAGQIQHVASHYTDQWLGLSDSTLRLSMRSAAAPTLRPVLLAFPSSAIGFVAFEYGKKFAT